MSEELMALTGVKVVDLSRYMPGPYSAFMLADYGADVVRVEQPHEVKKKKIVYRQDKMSQAELQKIRAFEMLGRNKKAVLLNYRQPAGLEAVKRLVREADVFVHDFRPGMMENAGLGYEDLKAINPRLVYCAVSACGASGPYAGQPGHDPISLSLTGALTRFGEGPDAPRETGAPLSDLVTALHAVIGILMALKARDVTGRGQYLDIAMSDAAFSIVTPALQRMLASGQEPPRNVVVANNGVWKTKDGKFFCTTDMEPAYWERFCDMVGRPDLKPRMHDRPATEPDLEQIFLQRTRDEWFELTRKNITQGAPVLTLAEALEDPHAKARGNVVETFTEDGQSIIHVGPLIKMSETPGKIRYPARMPGRDTREVLEGLGYSEAEMAALLAEAEEATAA